MRTGNRLPRRHRARARNLRSLGHLGDSQRNDLGITERRRAARSGTLWEEIIHPDIKCGDEGVEVGAHEASKVDVAVATPDFGALNASPSRAAPNNSESTI